MIRDFFSKRTKIEIALASFVFGAFSLLFAISIPSILTHRRLDHGIVEESLTSLPPDFSRVEFGRQNWDAYEFSGRGLQEIDLVDTAAPSMIEFSGTENVQFGIVSISCRLRNESGFGTMLGHGGGVLRGRYPINLYNGEKKAVLGIVAGVWRVKIAPISQAPSMMVPGTISGDGDDVIYLRGQLATSGHLTAAKNAKGILGSSRAIAHAADGPRIVLEREGAFDAAFVMPASTNVIEIKTDGEWTLAIPSDTK